MYPERVMKALQRAQLALNTGDMQGALDEAGKALQRYPKAYGAWLISGQAHGRMGAHAEAEKCFRKAIAIEPKNSDGWNNLGISFSSRAMFVPAADAYRAAIRCDPLAHPDIFHNLGSCLLELGQFDQALPIYEATAVRKDTKDVWALMAMCHMGLDRYDDALKANQRAIARGASGYTINLNIGTCFHVLADYEMAAAHAKLALEAKPDDKVARFNLGTALLAGGDVKAAVEQFDLCDYAPARSARLVALNYLDDMDPAALRREHEVQVQRLTSAIVARPMAMTIEAGQPLRVGLVSADLREHPVAYFLEGMLANIDRSKLSIFIYTDMQVEDATTARFRAMGFEWRNYLAANDAQDTRAAQDARLAAMVADDAIQILIDLSGHTGSQRIEAFAQRLAPVQASYLGYSATTGLSTIDYYLTDDVLDPGEPAQQHYTERLLRLGPTLASYTPAASDMPVQAPPVLANGFVTFGSFAQLQKISAATVQLWIAALHAVPNSRMFVMSKGIGAAAAQQRFLARFAAAGIAADRFIFRAAGSMDDYLRAHHEVDLILDTVPWNGHTTTLHALWMGVPTLTVRGAHHVARFGEMVMQAISLDEFVADSPQSFGARAAQLVSDHAGMASLRGGLRARLLASPLCDHQHMARRFEQACAAMAGGAR